jgi:predicted nucleic acid-binding protein
MAIRVYADTSVYGGVFDAGIDAASREFFAQVRAGRFILVVSAVVEAELAEAPATVRGIFDEHLEMAEVLEVTPEAVALRQAYLHAGIVGAKWSTDALHVALAAVSRCRAVVSWNFKHIVHFDKIPLYNGVNLINGYEALSINTPAEIIAYED